DLAAADLNGDGYPDIAVANRIGAGTVTVLINDGIWGAGPQGPVARLAGLPPLPEPAEAPSRADVPTTIAPPRPLVEVEDMWVAAGGEDEQPVQARPAPAVRADEDWLSLVGSGDPWPAGTFSA